MKESILLKVTTTKNVSSATIGFLIIGLNFQHSFSSGCHNLTMLSVNISDIAIITVKDVDYPCVIHSISKSKALNLSKNYVPYNCGYI